MPPHSRLPGERGTARDWGREPAAIPAAAGEYAWVMLD